MINQLVQAAIDHHSDPRYLREVITQIVEKTDPHAADRIKYAEQVKDGTRQFYLWEYRFSSNQAWAPLDHEEFFPDHRYHCTDISCMVALKGEPAVRMLRTEAQELQRNLGDTVEWFLPSGLPDKFVLFKREGTYTYAPKALKIIKWSDMPVGVAVRTSPRATSIGQFRAATSDGYLVIEARNSKNISQVCSIKDIELAPASEQPWIAVQDDQPQAFVKTLFELISKGIQAKGEPGRFKITGIAKGYKMEGAV